MSTNSSSAAVREPIRAGASRFDVGASLEQPLVTTTNINTTPRSDRAAFLTVSLAMTVLGSNGGDFYSNRECAHRSVAREMQATPFTWLRASPTGFAVCLQN